MKNFSSWWSRIRRWSHSRLTIEKKKNFKVTVFDNLLYEDSFRKNCNFIFSI